MTDWDQATYEALQEDLPRTAAILSDEVLLRVEALSQENQDLKEDLEQVRSMFRAEDRGWTLISGLTSEDHVEGLTLQDVQSISEAIRPHVIADGLVKRGVDLHSGYTWSKGMNIEGVQASGKQGRPGRLVSFAKNPVNRDSLFSALAHEELQKARYADGNLFFVCDTREQTVRRIPLSQITGLRVNPDFPEEVWAWKRTWDPMDKENSKPRTRWYYTSRYSGPKQKSFTENGQTIAVEENAVIVDRRFNRQVGYPLGIPDALGMMVWVAAYTEVMQYGRVVNESLAKILFKVVNKTKQGVAASGVKIANAQGHGGAATMLEGQDVQAISTAGKGYDFVSARPLAAMAATSINVSNIELLSDSSAAGSSYGAAQTLTPSTKNAVRLMQSTWIDVYKEIFEVFKISEPRIWFEPLEDVDLYRSSQSLTLLAPALSDEEYRGRVLDLLDIAGDPGEIPKTLKMRSEPQATAAQQAAPDQGKSNGTNSGGGGANDQRSDGVAEALRREMAQEDILARWEAVVAALPAPPA